MKALLGTVKLPECLLTALPGDVLVVDGGEGDKGPGVSLVYGVVILLRSLAKGHLLTIKNLDILLFSKPPNIFFASFFVVLIIFCGLIM